MRTIARFVALGYLLIVGVTAILQVIGVTEFAAPLSVIPVTARPPVVVNILYSSEQQAWLKAAAQQFAASGPSLRGRPIQLVLRDRGSQSLVGDIAQGRAQPVAIIPASSAQIAEVNRTGVATVAADGANAPQPVALSPLVLIGWQERIAALFPQGAQNFWQRLYEQRNTAKFGHTSPVKANSGMELLTLLAYAYYNKARDLTLADVNRPEFQEWVIGVESSVLDTPLPESTDALFKSFLAKGPSAYDLVVVYENQAILELDRAKTNWGAVQVLYPPATTISDHPFAILDAAWVKTEEQDAARLFRDFLLGDAAQRLARQYGFRPANANVALNENAPDNPFPAAFGSGVVQDLPGTVAQPTPEVLEALAEFWRNRVGR